MNDVAALLATLNNAGIDTFGLTADDCDIAGAMSAADAVCSAVGQAAECRGLDGHQHWAAARAALD